jgi:hypothetical protein
MALLYALKTGTWMKAGDLPMPMRVADTERDCGTIRGHNPKELRMASVLITGTSKGIGLEAALVFGRAGHRVHATMRNPSQSPALAETAAREKLPITDCSDRITLPSRSRNRSNLTVPSI